MMVNRLNRKRACVMIVEQDFDFGIKLADWLAAHGYQAVLIRSVETAIDECRDLRPQAVFIGFSHSQLTTPIDLSELLRVIETTCPHAPVVTMGDQTGGNLTKVMSGGALCHFSVTPINHTHIGRMIELELSAAAVSQVSTNTQSDARNGGTIENLSHERTVHGEAAKWIG